MYVNMPFIMVRLIINSISLMNIGLFRFFTSFCVSLTSYLFNHFDQFHMLWIHHHKIVQNILYCLFTVGDICSYVTLYSSNIGKFVSVFCSLSACPENFFFQNLTFDLVVSLIFVFYVSLSSAHLIITYYYVLFTYLFTFVLICSCSQIIRLRTDNWC